MSDALGTLANAPLAFVLAQIRLLLPSSFNKAAVGQAMHEALFAHYPRKQEITTQRLVIEADGAPVVQSGDVVISLASLDQREEILISPSFLSLQATQYEDYRDFSKRLERVVGAMFSNFGPLAVQQVGLRYVDFVYPEPGEQLTDYLPAAASFIDLPGKVAETCLRAADVMMDGSRAVIRITQGRGKAALPADLGPILSLSPSPIMQKDPGLVPTAVLDIDGFTSDNIHLATDTLAVMTVFKDLHDNVTAPIFRQIATPSAFDFWKNKK
jgi:uncharacterized protein (TIGR04255 family)